MTDSTRSPSIQGSTLEELRDKYSTAYLSKFQGAAVCQDCGYEARGSYGFSYQSLGHERYYARCIVCQYTPRNERKRTHEGFAAPTNQSPYVDYRTGKRKY